MKAKLRVFRYNPETDKTPRYDEFSLEIVKGLTILDCIEEIRNAHDATLAFERSCSSGLCGGCGLRINGKAKLACETQALEELMDGAILIEPLSNFPIIKDLVVDKAPFWERIRQNMPYFIHKEVSEEAQNNLITSQTLLAFRKSDDCIMCGLCSSECSSAEYEPSFLGPAAAAHIYRFVADPRDAKLKERLALLQTGRIWSCSRQFQCIEACPRGIEPGNLIFSLKSRMLSAGLNKTVGAKNAKYFWSCLRKYGKLDFRHWGIRIGNSFFKEFILNVKLSMKSRNSSLIMKKIKHYPAYRKLLDKPGGK